MDNKHISKKNKVISKEVTTTDYSNPADWSTICNTSLSNYSNMERRLSSQKKKAEFLLVYYSLFLIINSITIIYFKNEYDSNLGEYFGLILSIVLLAVSLIISNAHYAERINRVTQAIHKLKTIKRDILDSNQFDFAKKTYYEVVDSTELRSEIDFFRTIKQLCKSEGLRWFNNNLRCNDDSMSKIQHKISRYLCEINPFLLQVRIISSAVLDFIIFTIPCVIFVTCWVL